MVTARHPLAATRLISAHMASGFHVGRIAIGMKRSGYEPAHSSMCQSL